MNDSKNIEGWAEEKGKQVTGKENGRTVGRNARDRECHFKILSKNALELDRWRHVEQDTKKQ